MQGEAVADVQRDAALGGEAGQRNAEVGAKGQRGAPEPLVAVLAPSVLDERVEAGLFKHIGEQFAERYGQHLGQLIDREEGGTLHRLALAHHHLTDSITSTEGVLPG